MAFFGPFRAFLEGQILTGFESKKVQALLAYLAVEANRPHSRVKLAGMFWPEVPERTALANLRNALSKLRLVLHDRGSSNPFLLVSGDTLQFNCGSDCELDITTFEKCAKEFLEITSHYLHTRLYNLVSYDSLQVLVNILMSHQGPFLEGFYLSGCIEIEEWLLLKREQLNQLTLTILNQLSEIFIAKGEYTNALVIARRQVELEPWLEESHLRVMYILAINGQFSAALSQYETCKQSLEMELGIEPGKEIKQLYDKIRAGDFRKIYPLPEFLREGMRVRKSDSIFFSRRKQLDHLEDALQRTLQGNGQVRLIRGSPGQGKTALVVEFIRCAQESHPELVIAVGNCQAYFGQGDPFLPFREVLELLLGQAEDLWASGIINQDQAGRLWDLAPLTIQALLEDAPALVESSFIREETLHKRINHIWPQPEWITRLEELINYQKKSDLPTKRSQNAGAENLAYQFRRVIQRLARQVPLLLFLDDLQWADPDSLGLLLNLGRQIPSTQILIIGAYRPENLYPSTGGDRSIMAVLCDELSLLYDPLLIDLDSLDDFEFIEACLNQQPNRFDSDLYQRFFQVTRGHPLFTLELLRSMQENGDLKLNKQGEWVASKSVNWHFLPKRVETVIGERISRLPDPVKVLLGAASIEGERFTAEVAARICQVDQEVINHYLQDELVRHYQLIYMDGLQRVNGQLLSRYRFRHILVQRFLFNNLDPVTKAMYHARAGESIEEFYGDKKDEEAARLAWHFKSAEIPEKASEYFFLAGKQAEQLFGHMEAVDYFTRALELTPHGNFKKRYEILYEREKVYDLTGLRHKQEEDLQNLDELARELGLLQQAEVAIARTTLEGGRFNWSALGVIAKEIINLSHLLDRVDIKVEGYLNLAYSEIGLGRIDLGEKLLEKSLELAREAGLLWLEAWSLRWLGDFYLDAKPDPVKSIKNFQQAGKLFTVLGDRLGESVIPMGIGVNVRALGKYAEALRLFDESRCLCHKIGNQFDEMWAIVHSGLLCQYLGNLDQIREFLIESLEITRILQNLNLECMMNHFLAMEAWLNDDLERAISYGISGVDLLEQAYSQGKVEKLSLAKGMTTLGILLSEAGEFEQSRQLLKEAVKLLGEIGDKEFMFIPQTGLARLDLVEKNSGQPFEYIEEILEILENSTQNYNNPLRLWSFLVVYQILEANHDSRSAVVLTKARQDLIYEAIKIDDENLKNSFLYKIPWNRQIMSFPSS